MVDGGSAASHTPELCFQVSKYDINSISLSQIERLHVLIVALHQVLRVRGAPDR